MACHRRSDAELPTCLVVVFVLLTHSAAAAAATTVAASMQPAQTWDAQESTFTSPHTSCYFNPNHNPTPCNDIIYPPASIFVTFCQPPINIIIWRSRFWTAGSHLFPGFRTVQCNCRKLCSLSDTYTFIVVWQP